MMEITRLAVIKHITHFNSIEIDAHYPVLFLLTLFHLLPRKFLISILLI